MSRKRTYSSEVAHNSSRYEEIWSSEKVIASGNVFLREGNGHSCTLQQIVAVHREVDNAEMSIDVRGHWQDVANYSFRLFDKKFTCCAIGRLDIIGGPHDNLGMGIPLQSLRVRTPHFHKFDSSGYEYAYRTQAIEDNESLLRTDRSVGLRCFLDEENIKYDGQVTLTNDDLFQPIEVEMEDPLKGVAFE